MYREGWFIFASYFIAAPHVISGNSVILESWHWVIINSTFKNNLSISHAGRAEEFVAAKWDIPAKLVLGASDNKVKICKRMCWLPHLWAANWHQLNMSVAYYYCKTQLVLCSFWLSVSFDYNCFAELLGRAASTTDEKVIDFRLRLERHFAHNLSDSFFFLRPSSGVG